MAQLKSTNITGNLVVTGNTLASKIIKLGGTNTEILLANGDTLDVPTAGLGTVTEVALTPLAGITIEGDPITSAGSISIGHANTSDVANLTGSDRTYVKSLKFDQFGHVTEYTTGTETVTNTDTKVTQSNTDTANWRKIVLSYQSDATMGTATTQTTNVVYVTPKIEAQSSTGSLRMTGDMLLHNPDGGDSPKLVFQRGDEKGNVTDWNMYVQSGTLKINSVPTSNSTTEKNIADFTYNGGMTVYSPSNSSGEIASMTVKTSNGGQLIIGKEGPNSGTMLRFDQTAGTPRLRFRASSTAGAMVWEQPEKAARLYLDFGNAAGNGTNRVNVPNPEGGGTLALLSDLNNFVTSIPDITITDTTNATTKPIVSDITAEDHTITVSRIGIDDLGLASAYKYKGTKTNLAAIQAVTTKEIGDVYNAEDTGMNYAWNGTIWDALGSTVTVGNGTLTVKTTGTGISASGTFTANQETNSQLSITLNSNSEGNRTVGQVVIAKDTGVIATDKLAISYNTSTKATWQYNNTDDCIELVW